MFTSNPFAELSASIPTGAIQAYVIIMIILVAGGTLFDVMHKKSAQYFFASWRKSKDKGTQQIGSGKLASMAVQTAVVEGLMSAEFCNAKRRAAHLLTMYGFIAYVLTTAIMVFSYPSTITATPVLITLLWYLGALAVCVGGYWFWFFIRVDVAAEGNSPFRLVRADLFVVALTLSCTLGLLWAVMQSPGASLSGATGAVFWLYVIATTVLFGSVPWSKFAHMFFKPAAALEKRMSEASGSRNNLPPPADKPEVFGNARRLPRHY